MFDDNIMNDILYSEKWAWSGRNNEHDMYSSMFYTKIWLVSK